MVIKVIMGLGNPGRQYERTRHNAGRWFIDKVAASYNVSFKQAKLRSTWTAEIFALDQRCILLYSDLYMNQSGISISQYLNYYKLSVRDCMVVYDDLDIPAGACRFKQAGGHGGHNGVRNIIEQLGSADFFRLKLGIGHPGNKDDVTDFVLSPPTSAENSAIHLAMANAFQLLPDMILGNIDKVARELKTN